MRRHLVLAAVLSLVLAGPLVAQAPARALVGNRAQADSLGPEDTHAFTVELPAGRFVMGEVDQQSLDVVITIKDPAGATMRRIDFASRGPEPFQLESERAGTYRIELTPFEKQTGRYSIALSRIEPIATRPAARMDQVMAGFASPNIPGAVIGVVRDGELVFSKAYGAANLVHGIPFRVETHTNIGSTSKQFTAFAIELLAQRGALSLDDDVRLHIPELPDLGSTVTVRHLLTHTSGYREFLNTLALTGRRLDHGDWIERSEIIRMIQRQPELQNAPGAEWNYNNSGYALLAMIVERKSGDDFPDWMRENVFEPLGMTDTEVRENPAVVVRNSAQGYVPGEGGTWMEASDLSGAMGAGGIYTTVADLARWMRNFRRASVGGPAVFGEMTTRYVLTSGDTTDYGLGLFVDEYRGLRRVQHGGADIAHRSTIAYFPELDAGVIVLSNNATANVALLADQIADSWFGERMDPRDEQTEAVASGEAFDPARFDAQDFEGLAGRYELAVAPGFILSFMMEGDSFYTQATGQGRVPIYPTSDSTFELRVVQASVTFHRNAEGRADSVTLHQGGNHIARRIAGDSWQPDLAALREYTGRYYSPEIETFYELVIEDSALVVRHPRVEDAVKLTPGSARDRFSATFPLGEVRFTRNAAGEVQGLEAANVRTRGVRFRRTTPDDPHWRP